MKDEARCFGVFPLTHFAKQPLAKRRDDQPATRLAAWAAGTLAMEEGATHWGFVYEGSSLLTGPSGSFTLSPGMYFAAPGPISIGGQGQGWVVSRWDYRGFFLLGGPIEKKR